MEEKKNSKLYYSIKEVAERFNVPESTLRFWEKEFKQIKPKRAGRGIRQYTESDIRTIGMVHRLLVTEGLKIEAAKQKMSTRKDVLFPVLPTSPMISPLVTALPTLVLYFFRWAYTVLYPKPWSIHTTFP